MSHKEIKQRRFLHFVKRNQKKTSEALDFLFQGLKTEAVETKEASKVISKYILKGDISKEEEQLLKTQVADILKIVGIGIPFVLLPGASIIIPFILKAAEKRNIDIFPSAFSKDKK